MTKQRAIRKWGTLGRISLGALFLILAFSNFTLSEFSTPPSRALIFGLVVFPGALLALQWLRLRFSRSQLNAIGAAGYLANCAIGFAAVLISLEGALIFYGLSLLLAAARGYAGCEVLAISNWLLRRDDQVGCVVFSPIDAAEARLSPEAKV